MLIFLAVLVYLFGGMLTLAFVLLCANSTDRKSIENDTSIGVLFLGLWPAVLIVICLFGLYKLTVALVSKWRIGT